MRDGRKRANTFRAPWVRRRGAFRGQLAMRSRLGRMGYAARNASTSDDVAITNGRAREDSVGLKPRGGCRNRIRAIPSAVILGRRFNRS